MKYEDFYNYYDKLNDKEIKNHWTYADSFTFVEYYWWPNKVDFLKEFTKVFKDYTLWDVLVDENIWLIVVGDDMYIWKQFLLDCIKTKIYWEKAREKYYEELEDYMNNQKK